MTEYDFCNISETMMMNFGFRSSSSSNNNDASSSQQQESPSITTRKQADNSNSVVVVDRYKHDMEQARLMRQRLDAQKRSKMNKSIINDESDNNNNNNNNKKKQLSESDVQMGLNALDEADDYKVQGDLEKAMKINELALELLIQFLKSDPSTAPSIDRDVVASRVRIALSNAEETKRSLRQQQQQEDASSITTSSSTTQRGSKKLPTTSKKRFEGTYEAISSILDTATRASTKKNTTESKMSKSTKLQQTSGQSTTISPLKPSNKKKSITKKTKPSSQPRQVSRFLNSNDPILQTIKSDLYVDQSQLQNTSWKDIAGLETAKQSLQEAAVLPLMRPDLFTGLRKPRNILLYGPPGTGKTMLVRAVAKESQCLLFICTASALTSKWHGEGEKLVRTLFEVARAAAPSIIFVDEMDALLSSRKSDGEHEASRRFKTEFMTQMDGIVKNDTPDGGKHVLLISCTNCPWDIDSAVLRRFPRRIYIPLPDPTTRTALLQKLLDKAGKHNLSSSQRTKLIERTAGFSGSDIASIASEAAFGPLRSLGGMDAIRGVKAKDIRPISYKDFETAINQATKSVPPALLKQYERWKEEQSAS